MSPNTFYCSSPARKTFFVRRHSEQALVTGVYQSVLRSTGTSLASSIPGTDPGILCVVALINPPAYTTLQDTYLFISVPFIIFALLFFPPPSRNSDPGSRSRLFSPAPHYGSCLAFLSREDFSSFFQRRLASNCACLHYALSAVDAFFLQKMAGFDLQDQHY